MGVNGTLEWERALDNGLLEAINVKEAFLTRCRRLRDHGRGRIAASPDLAVSLAA
jgi:hypothetical protein